MRPFIYLRLIWWFPRHLPGQNAQPPELFPGVHSDKQFVKGGISISVPMDLKAGRLFLWKEGSWTILYDALGEFGSISDRFRLVVIHKFCSFDVVSNVHRPGDCLRDYMSPIRPPMKWTAIYHIVRSMYLINDVFPANCVKYMTKIMANLVYILKSKNNWHRHFATVTVSYLCIILNIRYCMYGAG